MHRRFLLASAFVIGLLGGACADGAAGAPSPLVDVVDAFDGTDFGFLTGVSVDAATVIIDPAIWVADDREPNGYRIDDPGVPPVELPVADDAVIEVYRSTGDPATATAVTVAELADWLAGLAMPEVEAAFDVTVADGQVVELRFVYRP